MSTHQLFLGLFCCVLLLSSCSTNKYATKSSNADYYEKAQGYSYADNDKSGALYQVTDDDEKGEENPTSPTAKKEVERKMIYTASLSVEVDSIEPAKKQALSIMKSFNGYMLNSSNQSVTVRIPAKELTPALTAFKKIGKVTYENLHGNDVTDKYFDTKMRLENAEKTRKRYLELLEQAKSVSEIIKVEKELERVNEKVETLKARMKGYNQNINYSKVNIGFQAKEDKVRPGPLGYIFVGLYKGIKWLFVWN